MAPLLLLLLLPAALADLRPEQLLVLTVATERTEGYERFLRSAQRFNYSVQTLGLGQPWRGGDVAHTVGGGQKVRWLREALEPLKRRGELLVLFVDSYDVVLAGPAHELLASFSSAPPPPGLLFSAEGFCWPRGELASSYPPSPPRGKPFLNSGGFIGFAPAVWRLVEQWNHRDDDDDQLFYTQLYLQPQLREELGLALDHHSRIFQNLNGAIDEVVVKFEPGRVRVRNVASDSLPIVIHGNGPTKPEQLPWVLVGVFVEEPTPFLPRFLRRLLRWSYPGARMGLFLHNREPHHQPHVATLWPRLRSRFSFARLVGPEEGLEPAAARDLGMSLCRQDPQCQHYLSLDADVALTHMGTLRALLRQNRRVLAPLLSRPGQLWSNFWGALSPDGFYARSQDYVDIVQGNRRSVWNVPYISHAYLIEGAALRGPLGAGPVFSQSETDPDMALCQRARETGLFLHVTNREHFGHLLVTSNYNSSRKHPDLLQLPHNTQDWEQEYLHENYSRIFQESLYEEPCPDVFRFPLFSARFCRELLEEALGYGAWSQEQPGVLSVPLSRLGLDGLWMGALNRFLAPIARRLFPGYQHKGRAVFSSVVQYSPAPTGEEAPPPPAATVSVSLGLSPPRGGGWRFPRYDCGVLGPPRGWVLLHPGRLTHRPQLLPPPHGTRFALVTLLEP
ncbi:multifunctional procollagen lysine hydroxylase and glycosyltransferase LH3-like isoform X2 [Melopsittacus undulatus]|uniref:PLOD1-3-like GT domain-containing protein n=1 Tax=Melopsittacus undulatus TaxID=13146 RepID=A0A8V5HBP4_MELUD|nr:multifunctional procollagen lysine hydroxylase and glycosyltransferase LH3-like isoform X2 [Melopsittacus undulatus]